jgi:hypothetical protein
MFTDLHVSDLATLNFSIVHPLFVQMLTPTDKHNLHSR